MYMYHRFIQEQVLWAVKAGADMMIGETFNDLGEAKLALEAIQKYGNGKLARKYFIFY